MVRRSQSGTSWAGTSWGVGRRMMKASVMLVGGLCLLLGCAGKGEVVHLNLQGSPAEELPKVKGADQVTVAVLWFEDARSDRKHLGVRTHLGGGETHFQSPGGNTGEAVAKVVRDYLKARGWNVVPASQGKGSPDVTITGKVQELTVLAKSRFFGTDLTAKSKLAVQVKNSSDGSTVNLSVFGNGEDTEVWFDPEDAQELVNEAIRKSLEYLVANTKLENRSLRLVD